MLAGFTRISLSVYSYVVRSCYVYMCVAVYMRAAIKLDFTCLACVIISVALPLVLIFSMFERWALLTCGCAFTGFL